MTEDKGKDRPGGDEESDEAFEEEHLFDEAEFEAEGWSIPRDPESVTRMLRSLEGFLPDILKRSAQEQEAGEAGEEGVGDSAAERLRARLSDKRLPREAVSFIIGQVDATKREFLRILSREIRIFLENMDLGGELAKILTSLSFEVRMEVRFIPNDQALKPSARGKMRLKRNRPEGEDDEADEDEDEPSAEESDDSDEKSRRRRWSLRRRGRDDDSDKSDSKSDKTGGDADAE